MSLSPSRDPRTRFLGCERLPTLLIAALCLTAVSSGRSVPADEGSRGPSRSESAAIAGHLKKAFDAGFVIGPNRLQEAQKHLNQALKLAPDDPRVDFAHGLVLMKQSQTKQAIAHFETAIDRDDNKAFWPAWQAAIWTQLAEKRYEPALKQLVEFAGIVGRAEKPDEVSEPQREAARWIGQIIAAAANSDDSKRLDELLGAAANQVLDAIGDELWDELEEGRDAVGAREFALGQSAGKARQNAEKNQQIRKQRQTARLDKTIEEAGKNKEDNEKSKEQWKDWIDDTLARLDKDLGRLERDYNFLDQRAQSLMQSITLVGQELTAMQLVLGTVNLRNSNPFMMQNTQQQYLQRQNQYLSYQMDYNATVGRMSQVAQTGAQATEQRADALARYEKATGDLTKKNAGLDKWSARLQNEKQKLTVQKPAKAPKGAVAEKKPLPITFKTILPFDVQHESEQLLASFAPPAKPAETKLAEDARP